MDRIEPLRVELLLIRSEALRSWVTTMLDQFPNLGLWEKPAVFNTYLGRPEDEKSQGGLLRHTKRVLSVAVLICDQGLVYVDRDVVVSSSILHDIAKWGDKDEYTPKIVKDHAGLAADWLTARLDHDIIDIQKLAVIHSVRSHMGVYGTVIPQKIEERVVAWADAVASKYQP